VNSGTLDAVRNRSAVLIGGEWVAAASGVLTDVRNPADDTVIGRVPHMDAGDVDFAVSIAERAQRDWRRVPAKERATLIRRWTELVVANTEELAVLLSTEQGKPLREARTEIAQTVSYLEWYAEEARRIYGEVIPANTADRRLHVTREPVGVVGIITPWNFPSSMIARKAGAALAAGCTVVIKPAAETPFSAIALAQLAAEAGIPAGVVNVVTGSGSVVGGALTANPAVRKVSFTGSTEVGRSIARDSAETLKRVTLELGGNAPLIVFEDADLDRAVAGAIASKFRNAGQTCVATNRIYVQSSIADAFAERFAAAAAALVVGDGLAEGTDIGPVINRSALESISSVVESARDGGARVVTGGTADRLFYAPTVVLDVHDDMEIVRAETFGPVAPISTFETEEEVLERANATPYGLAAYFYTADLARSIRVAEGLEFGMVGVNESLVATEVAPFGGVKHSGYGREGSSHGIDDYVSMKYVCIGGLT